MTILFFGGTFDPPHKEHVAMAEEAVKQFRPDKLIIMPTFLPPHKETFFCASAADRLAMCKLAFSGIPCAEISDYEIAARGKSYSCVTMKALSEKYRGAKILFLMGTDMLDSFDRWKNPEVILQYSLPVLCEREGDGVAAEDSVKRFYEKFGVKPEVLAYSGKNVSSTTYKIDRLLGLPTGDIVPEKAESYADKNGLYAPDERFLFLRSHLKRSRLIHTAGVMKLAIKLAKKTGASTKKAFIAAALHDCAKYEDPAEYPSFSLPEGVPEPVVHQFLGAFIAENVLGEKDEEILGAIRWHTSGKPDMTLLEKIVFSADMAEENRVYPGAEELRAALEKDFETGFRLCLKRSYEFVIGSGKPVYGLTREAAEYYSAL